VVNHATQGHSTTELPIYPPIPLWNAASVGLCYVGWAMTQATHTLSITLSSGETHTFTTKAMPKHWRSWIMRQLPYGVSCNGATFNRQ
jgi:hypothetical protein